MANKTIDQLTAAAAALATQELEVYDPAGTPKSQKVTGAQLKTFCGGSSPSVSDFLTVFGSLPSSGGTYPFDNTTGKVLLVTFYGYFDLTTGGMEYLQINIAGYPVAVSGYVDGGYNSNTLTDKAGFQITWVVPVGGSFVLLILDDAGDLAGTGGQVLSF